MTLYLPLPLPWRFARVLALLAGAILLVIAAGCGGSSDAPSQASGPPPTLPACAQAKPVKRPRALPAEFPLPPGTVVTANSAPHTGQLVLGALIPADLQDAAAFFDESLPESGYRQGLGDSESGEAEAPFTGNGFRGKWRVNAIANCPSAVVLTLVLIRQA